MKIIENITTIKQVWICDLEDHITKEIYQYITEEETSFVYSVNHYSGDTSYHILDPYSLGDCILDQEEYEELPEKLIPDLKKLLELIKSNNIDEVLIG